MGTSRTLARPPPCRLVPIDGRRLHVCVLGAPPRPGGPTVVLESGLGAPLQVWAWIQPQVARFARVVAYDRPGLGRSDPLPGGGCDGRATARRLRAALARLGHDGPLVLVGHSFGALLVRVFADCYPDLVAGVVLVEPSHPEQFEPHSRLPPATVAGFRRGLDALARRQAARPLARFVRGLPARELDALRAALSSARHLEGAGAEALGWDAVAAQARAAGSLGARPLVVLGAASGPAHIVAPLRAMHAELARLSTRGVHRVVPGDHTSLVTHAAHARAVVDAIREVVGATAR